VGRGAAPAWPAGGSVEAYPAVPPSPANRPQPTSDGTALSGTRGLPPMPLRNPRACPAG